MIPMPALSGVLITTGMGMLYPAELKHCYAVQKSDAVPFASTVGGMISFGLAEGIGIGCATALGMNMYQTYVNNATAAAGHRPQSESKMKAFELIQLPAESASEGTATASAAATNAVWQSICGTQPPIQVDAAAARGMHTMSKAAEGELTFKDNDDDISAIASLMDPTKNTVWQLNGPINFLSMFEIDNMIKKIEAQDQNSLDAIVLDMAGISMVEFTGVEELVTRLIEASDGHGSIPIQMVNVNKDLGKALDQCDTNKRIERIEFHQ